MSKYRGDQVKKIKAAQIPKFNSKTDPSVVSEFKKSDDTKWCLHHLKSFTKGRSETDNDQLFSIALCLVKQLLV